MRQQLVKLLATPPKTTFIVAKVVTTQTLPTLVVAMALDRTVTAYFVRSVVLTGPAKTPTLPRTPSDATVAGKVLTTSGKLITGGSNGDKHARPHPLFRGRGPSGLFFSSFATLTAPFKKLTLFSSNKFTKIVDMIFKQKWPLYRPFFCIWASGVYFRHVFTKAKGGYLYSVGHHYHITFFMGKWFFVANHVQALWYHY